MCVRRATLRRRRRATPGRFEPASTHDFSSHGTDRRKKSWKRSNCRKLITVDSGTPIYTQPQTGWLGTGPLQDIWFTVDVRKITFTGQNPVLRLELQTAADRDDSLFVAMVPAIDLVLTPGVNGGILIVKVLLAQNPDVVGRWVRWKLELGGATPPWSITFRILGCGNPGGR